MATGKSSNISITMGKVSDFNLNEDDWITHIEQLDFFFKAKRISHESERKTILLSSRGITTYKLFKGLTAPSKSGENYFIRLAEALNVASSKFMHA